MKTLVISVDHPQAEDKGSKIRTMNFVRYFRRIGEVDLMCYRMYADGKKSGLFRKEHYVDFTHEELKHGNIFCSIYEKLVLKKPWLVSLYSDSVVRHINSIILHEKYDIILCRYVVNAYPLSFLPEKYKQRVILDVDDIITDKLYTTVYGRGKGLGRIKSYIDSKVLQHYQRKCCCDFDTVVFCSEEDKVSLTGSNKDSNSHVIPNIVPAIQQQNGRGCNGYKNVHVMIFVGALCYSPNKDGIIWFLKNIYKELLHEFSDLRLFIVGKDPCEDLKSLVRNYDSVELVASPPDVVPYYEMSGVVIVPLLTGGGTRIKILEAGLVRRPVISTHLGAHGLNLKDRREISFFEDAETFIDAYRWLRNSANYHNSVRALNAHVQSNYSEHTFNSKMQTVIQSAQYE
jgi:glycosyltransferase involved in cell wall biosynthesis